MTPTLPLYAQLINLLAAILLLLSFAMLAQRRVLTLIDPNDPATGRLLAQYRAAASVSGRPIELVIRKVSTARDLQRVFQSLRPGEVDGAFLLSPILRLNFSALTIRLAEAELLLAEGKRPEGTQMLNTMIAGLQTISPTSNGEDIALRQQAQNILDGKKN